MIDTDKYEDAKKVVQDAGLIDENDGHPDIHYRKIALLLTEVKRLQYLEKYAPTFQVFAQNEEDMEEEYTQLGSLKECEEYIAALEDGWVGRIEVIEYYVPTNNPQVKTLEEWRNEE